MTAANVEWWNEFEANDDKPEIFIETGWRWERNGSGKYAGRYYIWRKSQNGKRIARKGGTLTAKLAASLPKRKGKGNRTRHGKRTIGDIAASDNRRAQGGVGDKPESDSAEWAGGDSSGNLGSAKMPEMRALYTVEMPESRL